MTEIRRQKQQIRKRGQNEGTIVQRGDGRWVAAVTLPSGRRKWLYGRSRPEVAEKLARELVAVADGLSWTTTAQTVEQYLRWWLEEQAKPKVRATTYQTYSHYVERHLVPGLGKLRLTRLSPQHVQAFLNDRQTAGLAPRSVVQIRAILRRALAQAVRFGLVPRNVAQYVDPPRVERAPIRPLTPEHARAFLDGIHGDRLEALYTLTLALGLRQGEALGLRWEYTDRGQIVRDIDLEAGTLTVRYQLQRIAGEPTFLPPKSETSRRALALPPFVVDALHAHRGRQLQERLLAGPAWEEWGLVFARPDGRPLEPTRVTHQFQATLARLGLPRQRFHDLRHGAASLMKAQGVDLKGISAALGHSQIAITADLYTHLFPDASRDIADRMEAMLGARG